MYKQKAAIGQQSNKNKMKIKITNEQWTIN